MRGSDDAAVIEVAIAPGSAPGSFRVEVLRSPAGEASAVVELPTGALIARQAELQAALLAAAASVRRSPETERPVREVGQELFAALLGAGEVAGCYRASAALAAEQERGLRLSLRIDSPELAGLPWEAMYDQAADAYICRQEQLVRLIPVPRVPAPLTVSPPLRILGVISAPKGLAALNVARERDLLTSALAPLVTLGLAEVTWAPSATWDGLHALLLNEAWHVLHFIGHGGFDPDADEGILALTTADGGPELVEAGRFTDLLRQARPMPRLVVLNSCSGATAGKTDLFAGTAAALTRAGVPAVAAMQFEITDKSAAAFARGFYTAIAGGRGVDDAVSAGRIAILGTSNRTLEWLTPVLYLRGNQTQLFTRTAQGSSQLPAGYSGSASSATPNPGEPHKPAGHVFLCYAAEDSAHADRLQQILQDAGIQVWRDTSDLWPGQDWRAQIRTAITRDSLVFLACFSRASTAQGKSRQNEELVLAIDELRQRRPEAPWLIPVRFDDCLIPDRDIGGGRTLTSLKPAELFGDRYHQDSQRLIQAVQKILGVHPATLAGPPSAEDSPPVQEVAVSQSGPWPLLINQLVSHLDLDNWDDHVGGLLRSSAGMHSSSKNLLLRLAIWLNGRILPDGQPELRRILSTLQKVTIDLLETFELHCEEANPEHNDPWLRTAKFYKMGGWRPSRNAEAEQWEAHVNLLSDLALELTRAVNWLCDFVRREFNPMFRFEQGAIQLNGGPYLDADDRWFRPQYSPDEISRPDGPYESLEAFKTQRVSRDFHTMS